MIIEHKYPEGSILTSSKIGLTRDDLAAYNLSELGVLGRPAEYARVVWQDGGWRYQIAWAEKAPGADGLTDVRAPLRILEGVLDAPPPSEGFVARIARNGSMAWSDRVQVVRSLHAAVPAEMLDAHALIRVIGDPAHDADPTWPVTTGVSDDDARLS